MDFRVNGKEVGSEIRMNGRGSAHVEVNVAALLEAQPNEAIRKRSVLQKPYWDLERARIGSGREVPGGSGR